MESNCTWNPLDYSPAEPSASKLIDRDSQPKINQYMYDLDSLTQELQTLNLE